MSSVLLVRPKPFADESIMGYIIRLVEGNGYQSPTSIWRILNESFDPPLVSNSLFTNLYQNQSSPLLNKISEITLKDQKDFDKIIQKNINDKYCRFLDNQINRNIVKTRFQKYCPECLKLSPYHRIFWDCLIYTACPYHKCPLVNRCPACDDVIYSKRNSLCKCSCGGDLRDAQTNIIPKEDLRISSYILKHSSRLDLEEDYLDNNLLRYFSFSDFGDVIYYFSKRIIGAFYQDPFSIRED